MVDKRWYLAALAALSCADGGLLEPRGFPATVTFAVSNAAYVRTIVIEVSGPGIDSLLVFNIAVDANGVGSGSARIPAGTGRLFSARAFDATGVMTHRGDTTVTLVEGTNPAVALVLQPIVGTLPITLTFGGVGLTLSPGDTAVVVGDTVRYAAGGVDTLGNAISPAAVVWSSSDQGVALVTEQGLVQARGAGMAWVLATYQGASVGRKVTVNP